MRQELNAAVLTLSAALLLTPASAAQAPTADIFAKTVAVSDMFEIQSGQLAADKAENDRKRKNQGRPAEQIRRRAPSQT